MLRSRRPVHVSRSVGDDEVLVAKYPAIIDGEPHVAALAFSVADFADALEAQAPTGDTPESVAELRARVAELEVEVERLRNG